MPDIVLSLCYMHHLIWSSQPQVKVGASSSPWLENGNLYKVESKQKCQCSFLFGNNFLTTIRNVNVFLKDKKNHRSKNGFLKSVIEVGDFDIEVTGSLEVEETANRYFSNSGKVMKMWLLQEEGKERNGI